MTLDAAFHGPWLRATWIVVIPAVVTYDVYIKSWMSQDVQHSEAHAEQCGHYNICFLELSESTTSCFQFGKGDRAVDLSF